MHYFERTKNNFNITAETSIPFGGLDFIASGYRTLFEPHSKVIIISDCHFGKATHFRKNHLPLPAKSAFTDIQFLKSSIELYKPESCIFLGDLFHSDLNDEWYLISDYLQSLKTPNYLVIGNHDILPAEIYKNAGLHIVESILLNHEIILTHEPSLIKDTFNICGHIHPGFRVTGRGRQSAMLPCFYVSEKTLIMPSFGRLTGKVSMNNKSAGKAYCFTDEAFYTISNPA